MKASEELLALRERVAGEAWPFAQGVLARQLVYGGISDAAYNFVQRAGPMLTPRFWTEEPHRTHLEVVEMIERAVLEALKAEET